MKTISLLLPLALATASQAATSLTAVEDNFVSKNAADTVQSSGSGTVLTKISTLLEPNVRFSYFKFDLASVTTADGLGATFTATVASTSPDSTFTLRAYVLNAGTTGYDWAENTITWNNRPAASSTDANNVDLSMVTAFANTVAVPKTVAAGTQYTFSLPNWDDYRQADDSLSVILLASAQSNTGHILSIATSENTTAASRPTLTIPEPSSAALLLLGGLFLARRKRS